jgi:hypothetical protein
MTDNSNPGDPLTPAERERLVGLATDVLPFQVTGLGACIQCYLDDDDTITDALKCRDTLAEIIQILRKGIRRSQKKGASNL